jgi:flagellar biosynthetic protein FlhB
MAEESHDDSSKTEEPTQKKLEEARKKGQLVASREINHFFMILALTFFVLTMAPGMARQMTELLTPFIAQPDHFDMSKSGVGSLMSHAFWGAILLLLPLLGLTIASAIAPAAVQNKWIFAVEGIKPKWEKLSPFAGFKRLFGMRGIIEFLKNLLKIVVVGTVAVMAVLPYRDRLATLPDMPKVEMMDFAQMLAGKMLIAACIVLFLLSIGDYMYQRFSFMKRMRMTKQELKDEYKQQEGDPHIKQKLRAIRREKARKRMMANVPKADVIITNPTHYAVALQYDQLTMPAPIVLAKGHDDVALRIREMAAKHKVPIVRNPPLARVLYDTTEIDEEIPAQHYQAVAKVIGYVYKLQGKKPPQGRRSNDPNFREGKKSDPFAKKKPKR